LKFERCEVIDVRRILSALLLSALGASLALPQGRSAPAAPQTKGAGKIQQVIAPREGAVHHQLRRPSYRVGDLIFPSGRAYRVNGEMLGARRFNLYVDFDRAAQPYYDRSGVRIEAELRNREAGRPAVAYAPMLPNWVVPPFTTPEVFGVPLADLEFSAQRR
jgi:hypothetical protein